MNRFRLSMEEFCEATREVVDALPEPFHAWLENVAIDVDEEPDAGLRRRMNLPPRGQPLMGLFEGRPVTEQDYGDSAPNRIRLFKRAIELHARSKDEIKYEIRRTVVHELAHHFGYSEDDLDDFESQPSPFDDDEF